MFASFAPRAAHARRAVRADRRRLSARRHRASRRSRFRAQANGSLIVPDGKTVGSALIGQPFDDPKYFWSRPSATSPQPYNGAASSGSNLGPRNPALADAVKDRIKALRDADPGNTAPVPVDLVTASGSGLDPRHQRGRGRLSGRARRQGARPAGRRGARSSSTQHTSGPHVRRARRAARQRARSSTSRSTATRSRPARGGGSTAATGRRSWP